VGTGRLVYDTDGMREGDVVASLDGMHVPLVLRAVAAGMKRLGLCTWHHVRELSGDTESEALHLVCRLLGERMCTASLLLVVLLMMLLMKYWEKFQMLELSVLVSDQTFCSCSPVV
jgi:hypothetical protein